MPIKKLRIGHICTNLYSMPPTNKKSIFAPGFLQSIISEKLVGKGHQVYMFASKDSKTKAKLIHSNLKPLVEQKNKISKKEFNNYLRYYFLKNSVEAYKMAILGKLDVIHSHDYRYGIFFAELVKNIPTIITIHDSFGKMAQANIKQINEAPKNVFFASISNNQRKGAAKANYIGTIYNGIDIDSFKFNESPKDYFAIMGRIVPEKGIDVACRVAIQAKATLKIAGKYYKGDSQKYFNKKIKPYLKNKNIVYKGLIPYDKMPEFIRNAKALLFPIKWEEPFGLVMTEAMASGTPVIAFNRGSVPEVVKHGKTGFIVKDEKQMINAIKNIDKIKRIDCRKHVEQKFSYDKMVNDYEKNYYEAIKKCKK